MKYMNDLLHHRFPGMTGMVYVANYSWYFTPMWELAKRTMPQRALRLVTFVNESELKTYIPEESLPKGNFLSSKADKISEGHQIMNMITELMMPYNAMRIILKCH